MLCGAKGHQSGGKGEKILAKIQLASKEVLGKNKTVAIISETSD
jgi:hypothetical protein